MGTTQSMLRQLTIVGKDKGQDICNYHSISNLIDLPSIQTQTKETSIWGTTEIAKVGSTPEASMGTNQLEVNRDLAQLDPQDFIKGLEAMQIFLFHLHNLHPGTLNHIKVKRQAMIT